MKYIRDCHSLGKTHDLDMRLKCGHRLQRNTSLHEDQSVAAFLSRQLVQQWIDRNKGLPIADFDIICPECQQITKFTEISDMSFTWDNHLVYD
jgi:hypothetical protein